MIRALVLLLNLLYAFSATGAIVYLHYCCGEPQRLAMEQLAPTEKEDCPMCITHDKPATDTDDARHGCEEEHAGNTHDGCYDVKVALKKTTEEHVASVEKSVFKICPLDLVVFSLIGIAPTPDNLITTAVVNNHSLSPPATVPLFIQHCTYRI